MVTFQLELLEEAQRFIDSLPVAASYKIYYNMRRVAGGERDKELFKKLGETEIWDSARYITGQLTVSSLSGTMNAGHWWSPRTAS